MNNVSAFLILTLICTSVSFGQDSSSVKPDTVIIYKDPVILKKTVYYSEPQKKIITWQNWIEISVGPAFAKNEYETCAPWQFYLDKTKQSVTPVAGYIISASNLFFLNRFMFSAGLSYTAARERFHYVSSTKDVTSFNSYTHVAIPFSVGFSIVDHDRFKIIPSAGWSLGFLLSARGMTFTEKTDAEVTDFKSVRKFEAYNYQLQVKCKFLYSVSEKISIGAEPFYKMDLNSLTSTGEPFAQYRMIYGGTANLFFAL